MADGGVIIDQSPEWPKQGASSVVGNGGGAKMTKDQLKRFMSRSVGKPSNGNSQHSSNDTNGATDGGSAGSRNQLAGGSSGTAPRRPDACPPWVRTQIRFMQEEHAKMLKILHDEVDRLQRQCAELTVRLAAVNSGNTAVEKVWMEQEKESQQPTADAKHRNKSNKDDIAQLQATLNETRANLVAMRIARDNKASEQVDRMAAVTRTHQVALRQITQEKDAKIALLTEDLDAKSAQVLQLSTQLHQLRLKDAVETQRLQQESARSLSVTPTHRVLSSYGERPTGVLNAGSGTTDSSTLVSQRSAIVGGDIQVNNCATGTSKSAATTKLKRNSVPYATYPSAGQQHLPPQRAGSVKYDPTTGRRISCGASVGSPSPQPHRRSLASDTLHTGAASSLMSGRKPAGQRSSMPLLPRTSLTSMIIAPAAKIRANQVLPPIPISPSLRDADGARNSTSSSRPTDSSGINNVIGQLPKSPRPVRGKSRSSLSSSFSSPLVADSGLVIEGGNIEKPANSRGNFRRGASLRNSIGKTTTGGGKPETADGTGGVGGSQKSSGEGDRGDEGIMRGNESNKNTGD